MNSEKTSVTASCSPAWADRRLWQVKPFRDAALFLALLSFIVFALYMGYCLRGVLTPILLALLLAYLFNPLVTLAHRNLKMPRGLSLTILLAFFALAAAGLIFWLAPLLSNQIRGAIEQIQRLIAHPPEWLKELGRFLGINLDDLSVEFGRLGKNITANMTQIVRIIFSRSPEAFGFIGQVVGTTAYVALTIILIPIFFFFFARHFQALFRVERYLPRGRKEEILRILRMMDGAVSSFFRVRLLIALIMCVMFTFGWWAAGVPYFLILGILAGLLSIIPYAPAAAWLLAIFLAYIDRSAQGNLSGGQMVLSILVWPSLAYILVQVIEGWGLTPWLQGKSVGLSAVSVIIVVWIGGALGGFYGIVLAIPIAACTKILLKEVVLPRLERWAEADGSPS